MNRCASLSALLVPLMCATAALAAPPRISPFGGATGTASLARAGVGSMRVAAPASVTAIYTEPVGAALAIGNRLVDLQADVTEDNAGNGGAGDTDTDDGGWDFITTGATQHPAGASYENLYGPIVRGLAEAAIFSGSARLGTGTGDVFAGISKPGSGLLAFPYYRIFDSDIAMPYVRWANRIGNAALKDTIKARHDTELIARGGAGGRSRTIRNGRVPSLAGLWPWDAHLLSNDSKVLAAAYPGSVATYETQVDSVSQVILDDKNGVLGPNGWNPAVTQDYHLEGLAGALRVFDASQRVDDNALAITMRDSLIGAQLADGSWGTWYGGVLYGQSAQPTAYAVLALIEYSARHNDAIARHAAFRGRQFLLALVQSGGIVDDGGGEYAEGSGETIQALLTGDDVTPGPAPSCISSATPCIAVPVTFNRIDNTGVRGFSVTLTLSPNLLLCGAGITEGTYLNSIGGTNFQVVNNGGGLYTVDGAILGATAGKTGSGTLFTLNLAGTGTGTGTVTINTAIARDPLNQPVSAIPGASLPITIDNTNPTAVAGLSAVQQTTANDADGTTRINLSWSAVEAGATVRVYRKGFGNYPEYDDAPGSGSVPSLPGSYPPAGWTLAAALTGPTSFADEPATRDYWYYVAYGIDACGNVSSVSPMTGGTLNYHLGDVSNGITAGAGNNQVTTADVSLLGANYGVTLTPSSPIGYLDVGPTLNAYVDTRPTTDNKVDFEDLMMFAINYGVVSAPQMAMRPAVAHSNGIRLTVPALPATGETFAVGVTLTSAAVKGVSVQLGWDATVVEPVGIEAGALLQAQRMPSAVLSAARGNVDVALLGTREAIAGAGEVARVLFRVKAAGNPAIVLRSAIARDIDNQSVPLATAGVGGTQATFATGLGSIYPNPVRGNATVEFSLRAESDVSLEVFDLLGRRVTTLVRGTQPAGTRLVNWNGHTTTGARLMPGMYVIRFKAGAVLQSRRVLLTP
jgi:hypothetical protein